MTESSDAISISSAKPTTTTASQASVYSYDSLAIEDYQLMQTSSPSHEKRAVNVRAIVFHARDSSETTDEDEDGMCSVMDDCTGSCFSGSMYTESVYNESSCSGSIYSRLIYTESNLEAERRVAPSMPYTEKDVKSGYYMRERSVYPYTNTRHQKRSIPNHKTSLWKEDSSGVQGDYDDDTATIRASLNRQHRWPSYDSELGERWRDSSASIVSSLFRRYGVSSSLSRSTSTAIGYSDSVAKLESSILGVPRGLNR
ncbi:hypothetical protein BGZ82_011061 [Podila clonocystis]|nr:hypothetical protein BGZ82_011061 [Podila clonocystis]